MRLGCGEVVGVLGHNGSGKTTALLAMAGALSPRSGQIRRDCQVGLVFQDAGLQMVSPTVRQEAELTASLRGLSPEAAAAAISETLDWVGLNGNERPGEVHPSLLRLFAIACMGIGATALLLDEPTTDLDQAQVLSLMDRIRQLKEFGVGVMFATHDERLARLASRFYVFSNGQCEETIGVDHAFHMVDNNAISQSVDCQHI